MEHQKQFSFQHIGTTEAAATIPTPATTLFVKTTIIVRKHLYN